MSREKHAHYEFMKFSWVDTRLSPVLQRNKSNYFVKRSLDTQIIYEIISPRSNFILFKYNFGVEMKRSCQNLWSCSKITRETVANLYSNNDYVNFIWIFVFEFYVICMTLRYLTFKILQYPSIFKKYTAEENHKIYLFVSKTSKKIESSFIVTREYDTFFNLIQNLTNKYTYLNQVCFIKYLFNIYPYN